MHRVTAVPFEGRGLFSALAAVAGILATPSAASAHFILQQPPSWMSQDSVGAPEKLGPCGDEGGGTATGTVTAFQQGQTITITVNEVVFHPGHYRVALSVNSRSELPAEPAVTTTASTPCGSAAVQSSPAFPVLADGVLDHTSAFSAPKSFQVTLPSNVTCTHCTLQIIEFMSSHPLNNPGGCFYHHCADISIQPASTNAGTGGSTGTTAATASGGAASGATTVAIASGGAPSGGAGTAGMAAVGGRTGGGGATSSETVYDAGVVTADRNPPGNCSCSQPGNSRNFEYLPFAFGLLVAVSRRAAKRRR